MSIVEYVGAQALNADGDGVTTGATLQVRFGAGAFGAPTNTPAHVADGYWAVQLTTAERANAQCDVKVTGTGIKPQIRTFADIPAAPANWSTLNISAGGIVESNAKQIADQAISTPYLMRINLLPAVQIPTAGTVVNFVYILLEDFAGNPVDIDNFATNLNNLTVTAQNPITAVDRSANVLSKTRHDVGLYSVQYSVSTSHAEEQIELRAEAVTSSITYGTLSQFQVGLDGYKGAGVSGNPIIIWAGPVEASIPDSGSGHLRLNLLVTNSAGQPIDPDGQVAGITVGAQNENDVSRAANLGTVTRRQTGDYYVDYNIASSHAVEFVQLLADVKVGGVDYFEQGVIAIGMPKNIGKVNGVNVSISDFQTVNTNNDKAGYSISGAKTTLDALNDISEAQVLTQVNASFTTQMAESYAANGVLPTRDQCMLAVHQHLMNFQINGTAYTVRNFADTANAYVGTLDSATDPTSQKRT